MTLSIFIVITLIYSLGLTFLVYKYFVMAFFRRAWFLGFYKYIVESNLSEIPSEVKKLYKKTKDDNRKILTDFNVVATLYVLIYLSCFLFIWIYILLKSTNEINHEIYVLDGKLFSNFTLLHLIGILLIIELSFNCRYLIIIMVKCWNWKSQVDEIISTINISGNYDIVLKNQKNSTKKNIDIQNNVFNFGIKIKKFIDGKSLVINFNDFKEKYGSESTKHLFKTMFWLLNNRRYNRGLVFSKSNNLEELYKYNFPNQY